MALTSAQAAFWHSRCYKHDFCISFSTSCRRAAIHRQPFDVDWRPCFLSVIEKQIKGIYDLIIIIIGNEQSNCRSVLCTFLGSPPRFILACTWCVVKENWPPSTVSIDRWRVGGWMKVYQELFFWLKPQLNQINRLDKVVLCISFTLQAHHLSIFGYT